MGLFFRQATRRGILGGSRAWTAVWALILAVRVARRLLRAKPDVVYSERLQPGESLLITHLPAGE
jgi:hypothetical protein